MPTEQLSYTQAVERLQQIVAGIERGQTDVEQLTNQIREARRLLDFCNTRLTQIEKDVNQALTEENP